MKKTSQVILLMLLIFTTSLFLSKNLSNKISLIEKKNLLINKNTLSKSSNTQSNKTNFASLCNTISLKSSNFQARCNNIGFFSIDLDKCITNSNGKLVYKVDGAYSKSCNNCTIKEISNPDKTKNYILQCNCLDQKGNSKPTEINLNNFLYFNNRFICDDTANSTTPVRINNTSDLEENCQNATLKNVNIFTATCANRVVEFNLNKCIGNFNGELALADNGNYGASCRNCVLSSKNNNLLLSCSCADTSNRLKSAEYALNKFIDFSENAIVCANQKISKSNVVEKLPYNKNLSASDNFMIFCKNVSIENNSKLIAFCGINNTYQYELNLNNCFSNIDGVLRVANNGLFGKTCRNCKIKSDLEDQYILNCSCQRMNQTQWKDTFISLKERIIINDNKNVLECLTNIKLPEDSLNEICLKS